MYRLLKIFFTKKVSLVAVGIFCFEPHLILNSINGSEQKRKILRSEKKSRINARRSLYAQGKIEKSKKILEKNIIAKRPGGGISPLHYKKIIGKKLRKNVKNEHKFSWKDFY